MSVFLCATRIRKSIFLLFLLDKERVSDRALAIKKLRRVNERERERASVTTCVCACLYVCVVRAIHVCKVLSGVTLTMWPQRTQTKKKNPLSCGVQAFAAAGFDPEEGPMCLTALSTLFSPSVDPSCLSCNSF